MNKKINFLILLIVALGVFTSCQDEYDPIGNNKPLPVLKLESNFAAMPSTAGSFQIKSVTNVEKVEVKSLDTWLTGEYKDSEVTLMTTTNPDDAVRETIARVVTVTGENEAEVPVRVIQGNKGMNNIFANMLRSELDTYWNVLKPNGEWKIIDNALNTNSPGDIWSVMAYTHPDAKTIRSSTHKFRLSVDITTGNTWAGLVFHAKDDKNFYILQVNINPGQVFVIVDRTTNGNSGPMAMDPGIKLSDGPVPYLRCEVVTTTEKPDDFTVNIYEINTTGDANMNTDLSKAQKLVYNRTFTSSQLADGGFAGVCGKVGGGSFRRFVLTTN